MDITPDTPEELERLYELQKRPQYIIPHANVIPNDYNKNKMNRVRIEALKAHIRMKGQIGDLVITPIDPDYDFSTSPTMTDKFVIVDGEHRHISMGEMGMEKVAVKIIDYTQAERRIATPAFNKIHGQTSEIGERQILEDVWDKGENTKLISDILMLEPFAEINNIPNTDIGNALIDDVDEPIPANLGSLIPTITETTTNTEKTVIKTEGNLPTSESSDPSVNIQVEQPRERTVAVPYFIAESNYLEMKDFVAKYRVKNAMESNNTAFYEIFRNGKDVVQLREENNKLTSKIERFEAEKKERQEKAEARRVDKMKKDLEKAKNPPKKKAKKKIEKEQTIQ